jgi:hypothetical protein
MVSPAVVEAAFCGRLGERRRERGHDDSFWTNENNNNNNNNGCYVSESFVSFLGDIGAGVWLPDLAEVGLYKYHPIVYPA